ncbi:acyl-CoA carboxylase subunit epsilon [Actinomadura sp. HBU206391]|uniref:acyl-CoA carboxylase subunit epsilon n=1 Tax=Actinomadura sp. HBU206391 TaxID=2731692 RepID=UPI00164FC78B|nr:acyl-CoA carboxylase subunit epsilon [Actinomadura sp. HBU206391]MBC6458663.1 acyl-CoA carboxylase subunit epsilon [Actinomadura sp. HBU206391]
MADQPFLQIVRGEPTAEEIAALVAVLSARAEMAARAAAGPATRRGSWWADRSRLVQRPPAPGPGAWRASAFPR